MFKFKFVLGLALAGLAISGYAALADDSRPDPGHRHPQPIPNYTAIAERDAKGAELTVNFQDFAEVANACDFHVRRMEYLPTLNTLLIETLQEPCYIDKFGKRKGNVKWELPASLRSHAHVRVLLNDNWVGTVVLEDQKTTFCSYTGRLSDCE